VRDRAVEEERIKRGRERRDIKDREAKMVEKL